MDDRVKAFGPILEEYEQSMARLVLDDSKINKAIELGLLPSKESTQLETILDACYDSVVEIEKLRLGEVSLDQITLHTKLALMGYLNLSVQSETLYLDEDNPEDTLKIAFINELAKQITHGEDSE